MTTVQPGRGLGPGTAGCISTMYADDEEILRYDHDTQELWIMGVYGGPVLPRAYTAFLRFHVDRAKECGRKITLRTVHMQHETRSADNG